MRRVGAVAALWRGAQFIVRAESGILNQESEIRNLESEIRNLESEIRNFEPHFNRSIRKSSIAFSNSACSTFRPVMSTTNRLE